MSGAILTAARSLAGELPCEAAFLEVAARPAFLFRPRVSVPPSPLPWVWYAPTLDGHPDESHAWMFRQLLEQGIAVAGIDVGESFGNPWGRGVFTRLWEALTAERGLAPRACLLPQSRGGLMLYHWAVENPDRVACVAGIYTVCDLTHWPGLTRAAEAYGTAEPEFARGLVEHNPIERLAPLAAAGVPILHVHGDSDAVVPLERHAGELVRRFTQLGGAARLITVPGKGHEVVPAFFRCQALVDFLIEHARASVAPTGER